MSLALALAGAVISAGVLLIGYGLRPPRAGLAVAIDELFTAPAPRLPWRRRLLTAAATPLLRAGLPRARVRADLAVLDRDPIDHLAGQLGLAALGVLAPAAVVAALNSGGASIGFTIPLWVCLLLGVGGFVVADVSAHDEAENRRLLMRHTLTALLDVVPPALAAGAGIEQALTDAARHADGWAAHQIRDALDTARRTRTPLWEPLRELGARTGVVQLEQLAGSLQLASGEGARIRDALTQRGAALAERQSSDMEAHADAATERMSLPLMALAGVFLLFLIYPAIAGFAQI